MTQAQPVSIASETGLPALLQLNVRLLWNAWPLETVLYIEKPQKVCFIGPFI